MRHERYLNTAPGVAELVEVSETHDDGNGNIRTHVLEVETDLSIERAATPEEVAQLNRQLAKDARFTVYAELLAIDPSRLPPGPLRTVLQAMLLMLDTGGTDGGS